MWPLLVCILFPLALAFIILREWRSGRCVNWWQWRQLVPVVEPPVCRRSLDASSAPGDVEVQLPVTSNSDELLAKQLYAQVSTEVRQARRALFDDLRAKCGFQRANALNQEKHLE